MEVFFEATAKLMGNSYADNQLSVDSVSVGLTVSPNLDDSTYYDDEDALNDEGLKAVTECYTHALAAAIRARAVVTGKPESGYLREALEKIVEFSMIQGTLEVCDKNGRVL